MIRSHSAVCPLATFEASEVDTAKSMGFLDPRLWSEQVRILDDVYAWGIPTGILFRSDKHEHCYYRRFWRRHGLF